MGTEKVPQWVSPLRQSGPRPHCQEPEALVPTVPRAPSSPPTSRALTAASSAVPDSIIMKMLTQRLEQQDSVQKGWVLHGFPRDLDQAQMLDSLGYSPNR